MQIPPHMQRIPGALTTAQHLSMTTLEAMMCEIWSQELGLSSIENDANFFDLGSKSVTVRSVQVHLQQRLQCLLPIALFYKYPTIKSLTFYLLHEID